MTWFIEDLMVLHTESGKMWWKCGDGHARSVNRITGTSFPMVDQHPLSRGTHTLLEGTLLHTRPSYVTEMSIECIEYHLGGLTRY